MSEVHAVSLQAAAGCGVFISAKYRMLAVLQANQSEIESVLLKESSKVEE